MSMMFSIYKCYKLAQSPFRAFIRNLHKEPIKVSWETPDFGFAKLNFDGSCKWETGKASIGGVLRDHNAEFLLGYAESIGKSTSTIAEFAALQRGLEIVLENGYTDLWLEGDYKTLIEIIAQKRDVNIKCDEAMNRLNCINLILPEFRSCFATHVYRQGNHVADKFAKIGHELKRPQVWRVPPNEVKRILDDDANGKIIHRMR